jgi:two-component system phosphate regulon sensor histidine kinase PhoR
MFWTRNLSMAGGIMLAALVTGWKLGAAWGFAVSTIAFALVCAYHVRNLHRLLRWSESPRLETIPASLGYWEQAFYALYQQLKQQSKSQKKLTTALDRFVRAGEAIPDGLVVLAEDDRIQWCNRAAAVHFGLDAVQDLGQQMTFIVRNPDFVRYLAEQDYSHSLTWRHTRHTDQVLTIQLVPFEDNLRLLISHDITQLERVQLVHRDFVANVSHELRTPLTVIGGFLETLIDLPDADVATYHKYLPMMQDQAQRMQRLVEDLLTLSRLENGNQLRDEDLHVPQLITQLQTEASELSQGRHTLSVDIDRSLWLHASPDELHSALGNLVTNAVRYTPAGGKIALSWHIEHGHAVFKVTDSGLGIAPEHIPRLTERFYRVDRGRSRNTGGTGLGLAIVKHILLRHQATLEIHSELGIGSTFSVRFPSERIIRRRTQDASLAVTGKH